MEKEALKLKFKNKLVALDDAKREANSVAKEILETLPNCEIDVTEEFIYTYEDDMVMKFVKDKDGEYCICRDNESYSEEMYVSIYMLPNSYYLDLVEYIINHI